MSLDAWRRWTAEWLPPEAIPAHPDLGLRYPWRQVATHRLTRSYRRAVDRARRNIDEALALDVDWRVGLSCGKDSTALALLLEGSGVKAMSVKDDLDYPGEQDYLRALVGRASLEVDVLTPRERLRDFLRRERVSLVNDLHSRAAELSAQHFYGLLDEYRAAEGYNGVFLGLRAEESRGRRWNAGRGAVYQRKYDGLWVAQPLRHWSTLDVHAFALEQEAPLLPLYLCVEPDSDPLMLRKSWWVAGGYAATVFGHYSHLRRWWPMLWEIAVEIDPEVATIS